MKECSKSIARRLSDPNFISKYFVGEGLDVGGKPDPLRLYRELFCRMGPVRTWDLEDGNAQLLAGLTDESFDFVHSSHCLEHLADPAEGIRNWLRVVRPGGHLVVTVPDEDLYEQGVFPSTYNLGHQWTFTIFKRRSWSNRSINVIDLFRSIGDAAELVRLELLTATYRYELPRYDQTLTPVTESGIEFVIRKRLSHEIESGGRLRRSSSQPEAELRTHLNQYRDDQKTLRQANENSPPFRNDNPL